MTHTKRLATAEENAEFTDETCSCGVTMLKFQHFTRCRTGGCPFAGGTSLLEMLLGGPES